MRLNQRQERLPPLQAPIPTQMVVSAASVASVLVRCYGLLLKATSEHERPAAVAAIACTACVQQVQRGARDVHGLLIAALTALVRAIRPWQRRPAVPDLPCHAVLLQLI